MLLAMRGRRVFQSPTDISGLILYLRWDVGVSTSGSDVLQWADQSGNGNHATSQPGSRPTLGASSIITGGTGWLEAALSSAINSDELTLLTVQKTNTYTINQSSMVGWSTSDPAPVRDYDTALAAIPFFHSAPTIISAYRTATLSTITHPALGTWFQTTSLFDGTNHTIYVGGTVGTPVASTGNFGIDRILLGARYFNGAHQSPIFDGEYRAVTLYNRALNTTTELTPLENWLTAEFSV